MVEWFTFIKPVGSLLIDAKSIYDRMRRTAPTADFAPGQHGVVLHIRNDRSETIIVERVDVKPPLLAFSTSHEVEDIANAIVHLRGAPAEDALAVSRPKEEAELKAITVDPFKAAHQRIKVVVHWRALSRTPFSRSKVSKTITVQDVTDFERASEKQRGRPLWTDRPET